MTGNPTQGSTSIEDGVIKYVAPTSYVGITEIKYSIKDELGDTVFSGTVKINVVEKNKANLGNGNGNGDGETQNQSTLKRYWWVPVALLVGSIVTWGISKLVKKRKNSV